jgi:hypothetical protein
MDQKDSKTTQHNPQLEAKKRWSKKWPALKNSTSIHRFRGGEKRPEVKSLKRPLNTTTLGLSSLGQWNSHHTTASVCNDAFRYLSDAE